MDAKQMELIFNHFCQNLLFPWTIVTECTKHMHQLFIHELITKWDQLMIPIHADEIMEQLANDDDILSLPSKSIEESSTQVENEKHSNSKKIKSINEFDISRQLKVKCGFLLSLVAIPKKTLSSSMMSEEIHNLFEHILSNDNEHHWIRSLVMMLKNLPKRGTVFCQNKLKMGTSMSHHNVNKKITDDDYKILTTLNTIYLDDGFVEFQTFFDSLSYWLKQAEIQTYPPMFMYLNEKCLNQYTTRTTFELSKIACPTEFVLQPDYQIPTEAERLKKFKVSLTKKNSNDIVLVNDEESKNIFPQTNLFDQDTSVPESAGTSTSFSFLIKRKKTNLSFSSQSLNTSTDNYNRRTEDEAWASTSNSANARNPYLESNFNQGKDKNNNSFNNNNNKNNIISTGYLAKESEIMISPETIVIEDDEQVERSNKNSSFQQSASFMSRQTKKPASLMLFNNPFASLSRHRTGHQSLSSLSKAKEATQKGIRELSEKETEETKAEIMS